MVCWVVVYSSGKRLVQKILGLVNPAHGWRFQAAMTTWGQFPKPMPSRFTLGNLSPLASSKLPEDHKLRVLGYTQLTKEDESQPAKHRNAGFYECDRPDLWSRDSFLRLLARHTFHNEVFVHALHLLKEMFGLLSVGGDEYLLVFEDWKSLAEEVLPQWHEEKILVKGSDVTDCFRASGDEDGVNLIQTKSFLEKLAACEDVVRVLTEDPNDLLRPFRKKT